MENWIIGKSGYCIVTDKPEGLPDHGGFKEPESIEYYGGALVCESVMRKKDLALISAAPDLFSACQQMIKAFRDAPIEWLQTIEVMDAEIEMIKAITKATTLK